MDYAAKPFGKAGRTDDALIDQILNSCLIAECISCIQNLSSVISINIELHSLARKRKFLQNNSSGNQESI
jgi:hypothetical protein